MDTATKAPRMTRIPTRPVEQRQPVFRDEKWTRSANGRPCDICGSVGTTVFAHMRTGSQGGMGLKPSDKLGAFLCHDCHMQQESLPGPEWWVIKILIPLMRRRHEEWRNDPSQ